MRLATPPGALGCRLHGLPARRYSPSSPGRVARVRPGAPGVRTACKAAPGAANTRGGGVSSMARVPLSELGGVDALWHTVAQGETVRGVAQQYGLTSEELLRLNPRLDARKPQPGLRLLVVAPSTPPAKQGKQPTSRATASSVSSVPVPPLPRSLLPGWLTPDSVLVGLTTGVLAATVTVSALTAYRAREESRSSVGLLPSTASGLLNLPDGGFQTEGGEGGWEELPQVVGVPPPARRPQRYSWGGRVGTEDLKQMQQTGGGGGGEGAGGQASDRTGGGGMGLFGIARRRNLHPGGTNMPPSRPGRAAAAAEDMRALSFASQKAARDAASDAEKRAAADKESAEALSRVTLQRRRGIFGDSVREGQGGGPAGGSTRSQKLPMIENPELFASPAAMNAQERAQLMDTARAWAASDRPKALGLRGNPAAAAPEETGAAADGNENVAAAEPPGGGAEDVAARMRADITRDRARTQEVTVATQAPPPAAGASVMPDAAATALPSGSAGASLDEWQAKMLAAAEAELAAERDRAIRELEEEATRLAEHIAMQETARSAAASAPEAVSAPTAAWSTRAPAVVPPPRPTPAASVISTDLVQARAAADAARARAERERVAAAAAESAAIAAEAAVSAAGGATTASYDVTVQAIALRSAADEAAHVAAVAAAEASSLETLADVVAERIALEAQLGIPGRQ